MGRRFEKGHAPLSPGNPFAGTSAKLRAAIYKRIGTPQKMNRFVDSIYRAAVGREAGRGKNPKPAVEPQQWAAQMLSDWLCLKPKEETSSAFGGPVNIGAVNIALNPKLKNEWDAFGNLVSQVRGLPVDSGNGRTEGNGHG